MLSVLNKAICSALKRLFVDKETVADGENTTPKSGCAVFDKAKSRIILYYVNSGEISKSDFRAYLKKNLPRYMLPHNVYELDELPQTPGGKLDRVKLLNDYVSADKD